RTTDLARGRPTYSAWVTCCSRGRNLIHNIIGLRAISIRSQDHERSYRNRERITCDMLVRGTDNHRPTIVALNFTAGGTANIDGMGTIDCRRTGLVIHKRKLRHRRKAPETLSSIVLT
ncbi:hypothetical protein BHE74_00020101, partial [Ensete ventricosum]